MNKKSRTKWIPLIWDYYSTRHYIGLTTRHLAFSVIEIMLFLLVPEAYKRGILPAMTTLALEIIFFATGIMWFLIYVRENKALAHMRINATQRLYEVSAPDGEICMRYIALEKTLKGMSDEKAKSFLIHQSQKDFGKIIDEFDVCEGENAERRKIRTHKTFARAFLQTLRDKQIAMYDDEWLEDLFTRMIEDDEEADEIIPANSGYMIKIRHLGFLQNKMVALRHAVPRKKDLEKYNKSIPYFEVIVHHTEDWRG